MEEADCTGNQWTETLHSNCSSSVHTKTRGANIWHTTWQRHPHTTDRVIFINYYCDFCCPVFEIKCSHTICTHSNIRACESCDRAVVWWVTRLCVCAYTHFNATGWGDASVSNSPEVSVTLTTKTSSTHCKAAWVMGPGSKQKQLKVWEHSPAVTGQRLETSYLTLKMNSAALISFNETLMSSQHQREPQHEKREWLCVLCVGSYIPEDTAHPADQTLHITLHS